VAYVACTTGTVALYRDDDGTQRAVVVEAWDEDGAPWIAGVAGLVAAADQAGFVRLERAVAVIPPPAIPPDVMRVPPPVSRGVRTPREREPGGPGGGPKGDK